MSDGQFIAVLAALLLGFCLPALVAYLKGRRVGIIILLSVLFWPAALIVALAMSRDRGVLADRSADGLARECPQCGGFTKREALACHHCGHGSALTSGLASTTP